MPTAADLGEIRHEQCRYGVFSAQAEIITPEGARPFAMPLCAFELPACPPAVSRAWGGAISMERDCAVCRVYQALD